MRPLADEVPFDIPDSWEWVRFGNIVANYDSKRRPVTKEQRKNEHGYYDYYGATGAIDRVDDYIFEGEYLMIGEDGGNFFTERDNAFIASGRFWANNHVHIVQPILCDIHFLKHFLDSCNLPKMGLINGIAVPKLNQEHLNSILVPLPPLSEQEAIVAELSKYAPLLDEYQLAYSEIKLLNDSFPERLKKSILQEAVQGKLVPQDPSDEPAEALLERIRAEKQRLIKEGKIKKDKHESVIFRRDNSHYEKRGSEEVCIDDEIPFEIPENWAWARLSSFGVFSSGKTPSMSNPQFWNGNIPWVTSKDMKRPVITDSEMHISELAASSMQLYPAGTLLLVARSGILKRLLPLCKLGIDSTINQDIKAFSLYDIELSEWLFYGIKAFEPYILKELVKSVTTVESLKFDEFSAMLIPVPPLSEQRRIIAAIKTARIRKTLERHKPLGKHDIFVPFCHSAIQLAVRRYHKKEPAGV